MEMIASKMLESSLQIKGTLFSIENSRKFYKLNNPPPLKSDAGF
jgi:hypothetical protein